MRSPEDVAATFCATLVDEWAHQGVTDAVVAPGSRSTPMALALAGDGRLTVHVHHDERSAGFLALGLGLHTGRPAVVLTTSGTAAVELHPAVVEAHHARVPLIAGTADRPPELSDVAAPQTIDQSRLFGGSVRWFAEPGVADWSARRSWRALAARAVAESTGAGAAGGGPGPVQLNLAFREPLVGNPGPLPDRRRRLAQPGGAPGSVGPQASRALHAVAGHERGLVVAGRGAGDPAAVAEAAAALGWPVLADPRSGVTGPGTVTAFDAILRHPPFAEGHRPDAVLGLGDPPASKVLAQWRAALEGLQVTVSPAGSWPDPDHAASVVLPGDPTAACRALARPAAGASRPESPWARRWRAAQGAALAGFDEVLAAHPEPTEPATARAVLRASGLGHGADVVVASSMPVRDAEWFGRVPDGARVLANRGANGIDGVVSTAVGVALANRAVGHGRPTLLLIGDIALLHDTNGLLGLDGRGVDLIIVCSDNDGGGIFSFLPQRRSLPAGGFEKLFGTPHGVDLAALAAAHRVPTAVPTTAAEVDRAVAAAVAGGGVGMVLVRTDRDDNVAVHDQLNQAVADRLGSAPPKRFRD